MLKIQAKTWQTSRFKELGRGGEAVVYRLKPDTVAKVFHRPDAQEFADNPQLQEAARVRLVEMQTKLLDFPADLPAQLVAPAGVLINPKRQVFGYVMPFREGTALDQFARTTSILTTKLVARLLCGLHDLVSALHKCGMVIGDFNENNVIIDKKTPYLIDADSMQFGKYQCRSFMPHFVAPELVAADKNANVPTPRQSVSRIPCPDCGSLTCISARTVGTPARPSTRRARQQTAINTSLQPQFQMVAPHTETTDWYSFLVIAMRLSTFTGPFGGVVNGMDLAERLEKRVTVFDRRVVYPRVAQPLKKVPRPLLELFYRLFHLGERVVPDRELFVALGT